MSFYKEPFYKELNGWQIDTLASANILAAFIREDKVDDWYDDEFDIDALYITYSDKQDAALLELSDSSHDIVSFTTLVERFNATIAYLKENQFITSGIDDLYDYDADMTLFTNMWNPANLATVLHFIDAIIFIKNNKGRVRF